MTDPFSILKADHIVTDASEEHDVSLGQVVYFTQLNVTARAVNTNCGNCCMDYNFDCPKIFFPTAIRSRDCGWERV